MTDHVAQNRAAWDALSEGYQTRHAGHIRRDRMAWGCGRSPRPMSGLPDVRGKDLLEFGQRGIRVQHMLAACVDEFRENEDLPNTTNPDDWAKISGKKGERIVYVRTLVKKHDADPEGGRAIERVATGQYL